MRLTAPSPASSPQCVRRAGHPRGAFLLEAMIAMLLFSIGASGAWALLASSIQHGGTARWRGEAFNIASATIARMSTEQPATLAADYSAGAGRGYQTLLADAARLPGVTRDQNAPVVTIAAGPSSGSRRVEVSVFWQSPHDAFAHRQTVGTVVGR